MILGGGNNYKSYLEYTSGIFYNRGHNVNSITGLENISDDYIFNNNTSVLLFDNLLYLNLDLNFKSRKLKFYGISYYIKYYDKELNFDSYPVIYKNYITYLDFTEKYFSSTFKISIEVLTDNEIKFNLYFVTNLNQYDENSIPQDIKDYILERPNWTEYKLVTIINDIICIPIK